MHFNQVYYRISLYYNFSNIIIVIGLGLQLDEEDHRVKMVFPLYAIKGTNNLHDVDLGHL